jgi:exodeoxyribonuclease VII large subunit
VLRGLPLFRDPSALLGQAWLGLDAVAGGLGRAIPVRLERDAAHIDLAKERLVRTGPLVSERAKERFALGAARLEALSPLSVLGRGYAVCFGPDGTRVIRSPEQVAPGDHVTVRVHEGTIGCVVESTEPQEA